MLYPWIYQHFGWLGLTGLTLVVGLSIWGGLVHLSYEYYFVWRRGRYVPDYRESAAAKHAAMRLSLLNIGGHAVMLLPIQLLIVFGKSRLYAHADQYGWPFLVVSAIGAIVFAETLIYWAHRTLHHQPLFGWLHAAHHRFREPTSLAAFAFNPIDSFIQALPYHIYVFLVPTNVWVYFSMYLFSALWTVTIHDRVRWTPAFLAPFVNHAGCHTVHHWHYRFNYGNYFTFWDRIGGTYRDPSILPEKFFASKLPQVTPLLPQAAVVPSDAG